MKFKLDTQAFRIDTQVDVILQILMITLYFITKNDNFILSALIIGLVFLFVEIELIIGGKNE